MTWNRHKKSWRGEAVRLRHTLACRVWQGGLKNDHILLHVRFWGGPGLKNDLES